MNKGFRKSSIVWLISIFVSQMPLAENACLVSIPAQQIRNCCRRSGHNFTFLDRCVTHYETRVARSTKPLALERSGTDMEIGKARR